MISPSKLGLQMIKIIGLILMMAVILPKSAFASPELAAEDYQSYKDTKYSSGKWDEFVKKGIESFHGGDYESAQGLLYKAFNLGCESPIVLFQLALISEKKQSYYSALEYYQMAKKGFTKANQKHRYNLSFNENYGRTLYFSGKKDEAIPLLKNAAKKTKSYWLLKLVGLMAYESGDTLNAVSYFERAVRVQDPALTTGELVFVYTLLARLFLQKGEADGAYRYYKKVLEMDPGNGEAKKQTANIESHYEKKTTDKLWEQVQDW